MAQARAALRREEAERRRRLGLRFPDLEGGDAAGRIERMNAGD